MNGLRIQISMQTYIVDRLVRRQCHAELINSTYLEHLHCWLGTGAARKAVSYSLYVQSEGRSLRVDCKEATRPFTSGDQYYALRALLSTTMVIQAQQNALLN